MLMTTFKKIATQNITTNPKINPMTYPPKTTYKKLEECYPLNQILGLLFRDREFEFHKLQGY